MAAPPADTPSQPAVNTCYKGHKYQPGNGCTTCRRETNKEYLRARRAADPEKHRALSRASMAKANRQRRLRVIEAYGGKCACCGETEEAFLVIDHVNDDGAEHRRQVGVAGFYRWLEAHDYPPGFQVLCANCNMAKGRPGGCPHKRVAI